MYKNPQHSDQARHLREILEAFGAKLSHAQALEAVARLQGHRTLHVAQAKNNAGVRIVDVAHRQAAKLMFTSLGRFADNLAGLQEELRLLERLAEQGETSEVDQLFDKLFRTEGSPVLADAYVYMRAEAISKAFEGLVALLAGVLQEAARAPVQTVDGTMYVGPMLDWRIQDGERLDALPPAHRQRYEVTLSRHGHQFYVDIAPPHKKPDELAGQHQLSLFIEVNEGIPCVHITNDRYGDQVLTVFGTAGGLYLRPDSNDLGIGSGRPSDPALAALYEAHAQTDPLAAASHAHIAAPNS